jgi:hypothetical protein
VLSGKPIPAAPLIEIGYQALRRLGYSPKPSQAALDYIEGRTMQVPAVDRIAVRGGRVKRKIAFGPRVIEYAGPNSAGGSAQRSSALNELAFENACLGIDAVEQRLYRRGYSSPPSVIRSIPGYRSHRRGCWR